MAMWGIAAVFLLVAANGFFVAAEFALVGVRRSRVDELVNEQRSNAKVLQRALEHLDSHLAATQLGITISSLALGWVGEPALAHLVEPALLWVPPSIASVSAHGIAVAIAFILITILHIVLGELAPKSLALQRSEQTALLVVRPLNAFLFVFRPAILLLNGIGNLALRAIGLSAAGEEGALHSAQELKLLVQASHEAGILDEGQQKVLVRTLAVGERRVADIMTPRRDVEWIDASDSPDAIAAAVRAARHDQLLVGNGSLDDPAGIVSKVALLNGFLDHGRFDLNAALTDPLALHESMPAFEVLESFRQHAARLAIIVDEYGVIQGVVTQTDLLEVLAGDLSGKHGAPSGIVEHSDGTLLIKGLTSAHEAFERLAITNRPEGTFNTMAGFAIEQLGRLPAVGETFDYEVWRFEITAMDANRIEAIVARRISQVPGNA